ncbi:uncharacterized protein LAJ45_03701 [Morchella importuna]|uniref:uncharacterized protein n=1 Tax=Morchella importuna TaxID=1174673 RepID=UPI001E8CC10E|nr:uncharacterized protein LAJ45_03701 [Morchella importuna]KAH8152275.1 hypothetical protein LAJ45_03701 [Morchella importuna]
MVKGSISAKNLVLKTCSFFPRIPLVQDNPAKPFPSPYTNMQNPPTENPPSPYTRWIRSLYPGTEHSMGLGPSDNWAQHAGALCMLVPVQNHKPSELLDPYYFSIHGEHPEKPVDFRERMKRWITLGSSASVVSTVPAIGDYGYIRVPTSYDVTPDLKNMSGEFGISDIDIACNYSVFKPLAAIAQICYGSFELYQGRGDQMSHFGYAAYSLTILPYVFMSFLNLIAALCQPEYPYLYMEQVQGPRTLEGPQENAINLPIPTEPPYTVTRPLGSQQLQATVMESEKIEVQRDSATNSPVSQTEGQPDQAARSAGLERPEYRNVATEMVPSRRFISCAVGEACVGAPEQPSTPASEWEIFRSYMMPLTVVAVIALPYLVIYWLTNFDPGRSTAEQRWWIMTSLVIGHFSLILFIVVETLLDRFAGENVAAGVAEGIWEGNWGGIPRLVPSERLPPYAIPLYLFLISFPAIGAFVMVARMMLSYEICTTI